MGKTRVRPQKPRERAREAARPARKHEQRDWMGGLKEWAKSIAIAFVLFLVIRTFIVQTFTITSGSMEDTLLVGDFLMLSKAAYGATIPGTDLRLPGYTKLERGDVIVFRVAHQPDLDLVKRLVGLPGDTLWMRDGVLFVNGEAQVEPYADGMPPGSEDVTHPWMMWQADYLAPGVDRATYRPTLWNWGPLVVPPGRYFVLGDNRDDSQDSRYWGFVDGRRIKGEALFIYFSFDRTAGRPFAWLRDVRWDRIGRWIE